MKQHKTHSGHLEGAEWVLRDINITLFFVADILEVDVQ